VPAIGVFSADPSTVEAAALTAVQHFPEALKQLNWLAAKLSLSLHCNEPELS
jgi:hypothetical protein